MNSDSIPQVARLFIAAFPNEVQVRSLVRLEHRILEEQGSKYARSLRWVPSEKWHVTLRFLGDFPLGGLPKLKTKLQENLRGIPPLSLQFGGLSGFPRPEAARVLYVGIEKGGGRLRDLAGILEKVCSSLGIPPETKPFSPHLTLARTKRGKVQVPSLDYQSPSGLLFSISLVQSLLTSPSGCYKTLLEMRFQ